MVTLKEERNTQQHLRKQNKIFEKRDTNNTKYKPTDKVNWYTNKERD